MKYEIGSLYRTIKKDFGGQYTEVIFKVVDLDYEHHKGYTEYLLRAISPEYFDVRGVQSKTMWVKSAEMASFEKLPKSHPAWILYGKK